MPLRLPYWAGTLSGSPNCRGTATPGTLGRAGTAVQAELCVRPADIYKV